MTTPQVLAFAVICALMVAFIWGRFRYDVVAALGLLTAIFVGIVPPEEAFSGFSDDIVIVVGSALVGGMGAPELVPFARIEDAQAFALRHGGQVMRLDQIPDTAVLAPVETGESGTEADEDEFRRRLQDLQPQQEQQG